MLGQTLLIRQGRGMALTEAGRSYAYQVRPLLEELAAASAQVGDKSAQSTLVLSVLLGWNIHLNLILVGSLVMIYTVTGGTRAVSWAQSTQMVIITCGMVMAVDLSARLGLVPADFALRLGRLIGRAGLPVQVASSSAQARLMASSSTRRALRARPKTKSMSHGSSCAGSPSGKVTSRRLCLKEDTGLT